MVEDDEDGDQLMVSILDKSMFENKEKVGIYDIEEKSYFKKIVAFPVNYIGTKFKEGGVKSSVVILFMSTISAGILGFPYAFSKAGSVLGTVLVILAAILNYFTAILLVLTGHKAKKYRYFDLAEGYGKAMTMCVKVIFFLNNWGIVVGYTTLINILISESLSNLWGDSLPGYMTSTHSPFWAVVINITFILPLTLQRNLSSLRYVCLVGFFFVCYVVVVIVVETFNPKICDYKLNFQLMETTRIHGLFDCWSICLFAFQCHSNILLNVFKKLKKKPIKKITKIIKINNFLSFSIYLIVGFFGYLTFADTKDRLSDGNILGGNYKDELPVYIAYYTVILAVIPFTAYTAFSAKEGLLYICYPKIEKDSKPMHFLNAAQNSRKYWGIVFCSP